MKTLSICVPALTQKKEGNDSGCSVWKEFKFSKEEKNKQIGPELSHPHS
jgi:hypothetical protein